MTIDAPTIVFLHIPKTAGQTIHNQLVKLVGGPQFVSPIRVHTQASESQQLAPGYRLYSGHIDWTSIDTLPKDRFVFTVLRDPKERIASFYFYLRKEAQRLDPEELKRPENLGKKKILEESADDYFFGGNPAWRDFILDHYDNFYCHYFASRRMRGRRTLVEMDYAEILKRAKLSLKSLDGVYSTNGLEKFEEDIEKNFGERISVAGTFTNAGQHDRSEKRWPKLLDRLERDSSAFLLERFALLDNRLLREIGYSDRQS